MLHLPGFSPSEVSSLVNTDVIREHAEDAASLWLMHEHAVGAPLYRLQDLVTLDARLLAHLEALRTAGVPAKRVAQRELANDDRSSGFVAAYLAFSTSDTEAMRHVVQLAVAETRFLDPVVAALAWSNQKETEHPLRLLSRSGNPDHRRLAIAVLAAHRVSADEQYECAASDPNPSLRARTLRAIGETKTVNLTSLLTAGMRDAEPRCRFWAAWSLALMGDERAAAAAYETGIEDPALSRFALEIAMRAGDPAWTRSVIRSFVQTDTTRRRAIVAAGMFGDPAVVPWLLPMLEQPLFARAAAEAFAAITGVDLEEARFKQDGPDEAPEEHDDDSDLRWPSPAGLSSWWAEARQRFEPGVRYLAGAPITETSALNVLRSGYQRQRRGAAIEVARLRKDAILFPTAARGDRQQRRLQL